MYSSIAGKIEKAKRYQEEPDRANITELSVNFRGENDVHRIDLHQGHWRCDCDFFAHGHDTCSHVMTMQRLLEPMLAPDVRTHGLPGGVWDSHASHR